MCLTLIQVKFSIFILITSNSVKDSKNSKFDIV
jgi:hypothetical protein